MAIEALKTEALTRKSGWARSYPPLLTLALALFIGATVLPSALNLPNSQPSTVLEYAPVPPDDDTPPTSTEGSISSLGLGTSGGLTTGVAEALTQATKTGSTKKPRIKQCVEFPDGLKQTSDPNSPPCVPFFDGDNGGDTWQGVTRDEITVLVYTSASISIGGADNSGSSPVGGSYCDLDSPPDSKAGCVDGDTGSRDHFRVRVARVMTKYFNDRFQTYGRRVHVHVFYANSSATASSRRADAADNWERLRPFAVIDEAFFGGFNAAYAEAMVRRKTMVFGSFASLENQYFRKNAPHIWSYWPDVEHIADMATTYICKKVAPYPVQHAGDNPGRFQNGDPRRYGLMYTSDPAFPGLKRLASLVKEGIKKCPDKLNIVAEVTFPRATYSVDTHPDAIRASERNIATLQDANVTTVLWLSGMEGGHTAQARTKRYFPEWVFVGDNFMDTMANGRAQDQEVWRHAWGISTLLREGDFNEVPSRKAYREVEPSGPDSDEDEAAEVYRDYFLLFKQIQVAGPRLTPQSVDAGAHAIPRIKSLSPYVAACFYDPGDFSCVKDANEIWYDPDAPDPDGDRDERGCYRMVAEGRRFIAGSWEGDGDDVFTNGANDPCNTANSSTFINPYGPRG